MAFDSKNINSGYQLLDLLHSCSEDGKQISATLIEKISNHENYKKFNNLGFPNIDDLNRMNIKQLFSFYNVLDIIERSYKVFKNSIPYIPYHALKKLNKPDLRSYESLVSFIDNLRAISKDVQQNYANIGNPFDIFNANIIESLDNSKIINYDELSKSIFENINNAIGNKNLLYCVSTSEYDNYLRNSKEEQRAKQKLEESKRKLDEIKEVENEINTYKTKKKTAVIMIIFISSAICNFYLYGYAYYGGINIPNILYYILAGIPMIAVKYLFPRSLLAVLGAAVLPHIKLYMILFSPSSPFEILIEIALRLPKMFLGVMPIVYIDNDNISQKISSFERELEIKLNTTLARNK